MTAAKARTKRVALRFTGENQLLKYKTEFESGEAVIANVSKGGCALKNTTVPLQQNEKILIRLQLEEETALLEIGARVVRVDEAFTAVEFTLLAEADKQRLVKYFAKKRRSRGVDLP